MVTLLIVAAASVAVPVAAASTGTLKGRVMNETTGRPQPGVDVTLLVAAEDGAARAADTQTTDARGRYKFTGLRTGTDFFYALDARHDGGLFAGPPIALPDDTSTPPVIASKLRVWDTTADPSAIRIVRDDLFLTPGRGGIGVIESVRIVNSTDRAYIGRGSGAEEAPSLGLALPAGAATEGLKIEPEGTTIDIPELVPTEYGFGITAAIVPGETRLSFLYALEGAGGVYDVSRPSLYPIAQMTIHTVDPLRLESNRLERGATVEVGDRTYRRWTLREPLDAGDQLQIQAVAEAEGLTWPAVLIGALLLGGVAFSITRLRTDRTARRARPREPRSRKEIVEAIATLDIRYSAGELDKEEWQRRRDELKDMAGVGAEES